MAVSTSALIPRVRDYIGDRPFATRGTAASATSVVAVTDGTDWDEGAIGEFQDDGEQFYVISVSSNDLTCIRGWNGTTPAAHAAVGGVNPTILRDPIASYRQIDEALDASVRMLWPYAWKQVEDSVTPDTTTRWFDVAATAMGIIRVSQRFGASNEYMGFYGESIGLEASYDTPRKPFIFSRDLPTALVASGVGMRFPEGFHHSSNAVAVFYAARITGSSDIEDSETLPVGDVVVLGGVAKIVKMLQVGRLGIAYNRDQAEQIPALARMSTYAALEAEHREQLWNLRHRCMELYPIEPDSGW